MVVVTVAAQVPADSAAMAEVLLADDPGSGATVWTGPGGTELAPTPETLIERGITTPVRDRADAAIACTDAELFFRPDDVEPPDGGIAAKLRC
jgi:hypothetical protein